MESNNGSYNIYWDISARTQGALYIGVVGPVRTGKSTFIKRFLEHAILPFAEENLREQMQDEMPQSSYGKTIMTTEPKFIPAVPAEVTFGEKTTAKVRLIDCVGFPVEGAMGLEEDGKERMVNTPWQEAPMPFAKAARLGTQKVICDHSTVAIMVTTDGSVTGLSRESYVSAEETTVEELKKLHKPFVIILNTKEPKIELCTALKEKYKSAVLNINVESMGMPELTQILQALLMEFPVTGIDVSIPAWMNTLPSEHAIIAEISARLRAVAPKIEKMSDCAMLEEAFADSEVLEGVVDLGLDLSEGRAECRLTAKEEAYYKVMADLCGEEIANEKDLMKYVTVLSRSKAQFDRVREAFDHARERGYGIVLPNEEDVVRGEPSVVHQGGNIGLHLSANATTYHIVKVDVLSTVEPVVGAQKQSEAFVQGMLEDRGENGEKLWNSELFGKKLKEMVEEELDKKSLSLAPNVQRKVSRILSRAVNEEKNNIFCLLF